MTHTIQNAILVFTYTEKIDEQKNKLFVNTIFTFKSTIEERHIKGILVSLAKSPHMLSNPHLENLVKQLEGLSQKIGIPIALGDYPKEVFEKLKTITAPTHIKLFQDIHVATLFFNPQSFKKELKVLLYKDDSKGVEQLSSELGRLGYTIVYAIDKEDFDRKAASRQCDIAITQSAVNLGKSDNVGMAKKSLSLSRELIVNLPTFMDTAVNSLMTITGLEAQKIKHDIIPFKENIDQQVIVAMMKFKGDIVGSFFLIFPRDIAIIALESMLGESIDGDDTGAITDGVGEFCNIITGATKAIFSNKKIKVLFELPKTFTSLKTAFAGSEGGNGVWIDMQLSNKPFYMFVTK